MPRMDGKKTHTFQPLQGVGKERRTKIGPWSYISKTKYSTPLLEIPLGLLALCRRTLVGSDDHHLHAIALHPLGLSQRTLGSDRQAVIVIGTQILLRHPINIELWSTRPRVVLLVLGQVFVSSLLTCPLLLLATLSNQCSSSAVFSGE